MNRVCSLCEKSVKNLSSHLSRVHKINGPERTYWYQQGKTSSDGSHRKPTTLQFGNGSIIENCGKFQLEHPFTALVAGMTGSGKTFWVQKLLKHAVQVINPVPQRIVWSYSQWQPAYDNMMKTVPGIEFIKGVPHDIDEDGYFDPQLNNLIVIDDQMTETANDKRIMNLFTKGSHHRNLSVIFLVQNLYFQGKIMRTLSLNAAYLVLFKNPRDKLQIMTLGRQMYPGKTEQFIQKYETAVQRPYGYLFVDLKPNTHEECRLRTNVLPSDEIASQLNHTNILQHGGQAKSFMDNYFERESYLQSPILKAMQNLEDQMTDILADQNVSKDVKIKEYTTLYNRFLNLQQQLHKSNIPQMSRLEMVQSPSPATLATPSPPAVLATPENVPSISLISDSGIASASKTPSFLERLTSKVWTPSTDTNKTSAPSTPSKISSSSSSPTFFSTPKTQSSPSLPDFLPTPKTSKEKPNKWIRYQDSDKNRGVVKPPRRSERLRAIVNSLPGWQNF